MMLEFTLRLQVFHFRFPRFNIAFLFKNIILASGDIIVNGVLASCHSSNKRIFGFLFVENSTFFVDMAAQTLQQTFFAWWRSIYSSCQKLMALFSTLHTKTKTTSLLWFMDFDLIEDQNQCEMEKKSSEDGGGDLPFGVEYLVSVMELFIPQTTL